MKDLREKIVDAELKFGGRLLVGKCVQIAKDYAKEEAIGFVRWFNNLDDGFLIKNKDKIYEELYEMYLTTKTK